MLRCIGFRVDEMTMRIEAETAKRIVGSGFIQFPPQRPFEKPVFFQPPTVSVSTVHRFVFQLSTSQRTSLCIRTARMQPYHSFARSWLFVPALSHSIWSFRKSTKTCPTWLPLEQQQQRQHQHQHQLPNQLQLLLLPCHDRLAPTRCTSLTLLPGSMLLLPALQPSMLLMLHVAA
ncbi:hypothetical protein V8C86DRAFT_1788502 [Haematococcus lacustris]